MEDNKIRIGITQGDINGVGYEVILKTFSDPTMLELCTPIIYGSPKVAAYHRKALDIQANFSIVNSATEAGYNRLSVVNCTDDEVKVEFSKPDPEAGKAALGALERAIEEYREGLIDVIVTAPINKHTIQSEEFSFPGHTEYIEERLGNGDKSLMILMKNDFRVALVTTHPSVSSLHLVDLRQYRNFYRLSIIYAFRPRLRSRLTPGGRTFPGKPQTLDGEVSRLSLATYAGILSSIQSTTPSGIASARIDCSSTNTLFCIPELRCQVLAP